jgi:hypothetical protein
VCGPNVNSNSVLCPPNSMPGAKLCVIEGMGHKLPGVLRPHTSLRSNSENRLVAGPALTWHQGWRSGQWHPASGQSQALGATDLGFVRSVLALVCSSLDPKLVSGNRCYGRSHIMEVEGVGITRKVSGLRRTIKPTVV